MGEPHGFLAPLIHSPTRSGSQQPSFSSKHHLSLSSKVILAWVAVSACVLGLLIANIIFVNSDRFSDWSKNGCPVKILELTDTMDITLMVRG
jgi:hypothetical protein